MRSLVEHLRSNVVAYLALFVALGGTAYAASKIGPKDIERNAVRAKHVKGNAIRAKEIKSKAVRSAEIANGQVRLGDLNRQSVGSRFGGGLYFGLATDLGPISSNAGNTSGVPILGNINFDLSLDSEGGPFVLLAPIAVRARDLRVETIDPVERTVRIEVTRLGSLDDETIFSCTLQAGQDECASKGVSETIKPGERMGLQINVPIEPGVLQEHAYFYSLRLVPG